MQDRAVTQAQSQLDSIYDLMSRSAMDENRYQKKSVELKSKITNLQEEIRQTELRAKTWQG